ncbi:arsenical pump-driving ATPase [Geotalea uraniireducens]|uniref:arsenite-transporting ATPase n=1 Tax=Geotalea uraniireducens (strain Rf4) TaxID=351605 RepID=A5GA11_GEOUR|nr:arsenical pump-driving ATPase [Geotalea uraniireducens]ABQ25582.1 arsenite efflux ATP-binding protein ArsA [Geotalea uraniireducens Rf4]
MPQDFLRSQPKNLFFTGKGGVGKTTTSAATAIALADCGKLVLLVSTDPASNLDEVLGLTLSAEPSQVPDVPGLFALNVDPEKAAAAYREKLVGPYRGILPHSALRSMDEQLSGACTVEIAAFNEFATLMGNPAAVEGFDHIIFDTAPTGHTLRLLSLPAAWSDFIDTNVRGTSCLGPLAGLKVQHLLYANTRKVLGDAKQTLVVMVSRPDEAPLKEAARASAELQELGVANQRLILNGVFRMTDSSDPVAVTLREINMSALAAMPDALALLPRTEIPLQGAELVGIPALRSFFSIEPKIAASCPASDLTDPLPPPLTDLIDKFANQPGGVIMTMGKGGVGKTTLAVTIATELARQGKQVHLTTTDPAAHVALTIGEAPSGMRVSRVDPEVETEAYRHEVLTTVGASLDDEARALLEEDLRSPCTEEIAVFRAFAKVVADGTDSFVVIDTAPTGHTLLLLDAAETYHREVSRSMNEIPEAVRQLLPRLRDPEFTKIFLVTLPEATPVHEALSLQSDLRRAGIEAAGWIINQSLAPLPLTEPVLAQRRAREHRYIEEVVRQGISTYLIPWQAQPTATLRSNKLRT